MRFSLACSTKKLGEVLGGKKISSSLEGKLTVATDYSIIYIALAGQKDDKVNFDVITILQESFSFKLESKFELLVKSAGFFQLINSKPDIKITPESLKNDFAIIPFPESTDQFNQILESVTCFWAEIEFSSWSIGNSLVEIGSGKTNYLKLYGFFAKSKDVKPTSVYYAKLPDFILFKYFYFQNLSLEYSFQNSAEYVISGKIGVQNFVDPNKKYYFIGKIAKKENNVLGVLKSEGQIDLTLPFNMPGISFSDLKFAAWHPQNNDNQPSSKNLYWLQGTVKYGALHLTGQIYLLGSTPVLVKIELLDSLSIETLFEQSIPGFKWPGELINITFKIGSTIYYYNKKESSDSLLKSSFFVIKANENNEDEIVAVSDSNTYEQDFNIYAKIDLTLLKTISFSGSFRIISEASPNNKSNGVIAAIQLDNSIDIYVLQIYAATNDGNNGPKFEVSTVNNNPYVRLKCGLKFFKTDFGADTTVAITKDATDPNKSTLIAGTLSTQEHFALFNNQPISLTFSYSKYRGFKVEGLPEFTLARNIIDFLKELENLTSTGGLCGSVANLVGEAYTTTYKITPSLRSDNDKLYFDLTGSFSLVVIGETIATVTFPRFPMEVPLQVTIQELPETIATSIGDAAGDFLKALMDDPEVFARFLAIVASKQAAIIAAKLVCEGLVAAAVQAAVDAGVLALATAGGIAAGIGAIAAATGAIARSLSGDDDRNDTDSGNSSGGGDDHRDEGNTVHNPIAPTDLTLRYENSQFLANWKQVVYAAGYRVTFVDSSGMQLDQKSLPNTQRTASLLFNDSMTAASYTIRVSATRGDYFSPETVATIDRWQTPTDLQLSALKDSQKIQVNWVGHETKSEQSYVIQLIQNSTSITSRQATHSPIEFDAASLSSGQYQVTITSTGSTNRLPSLPSPPSNTVYVLTPPEDVRFSFDSDTQLLSLTWNSVEFATGYRIRILNENSNLEAVNTSVPATNSEPVSNNKFSISLDHFSNPGVYYAQIFAVGSEVSFDSSITRSTDTVTRLEELQGLRQSVNKATQQLILDWQRLEGATQYEVELVEQSEEELLFSTVVDQPGSVTESPQIAINLAPYLKPQGLTLIMRVRSRGTSNILPGNFLTASNPVVQIAAPINVTMSWLQETGVINVSWQGDEQAVQYQIEIWEVATQSVAISQTVGSASSQLTIQESEFSSPLNGIYQLRLQALANENYFDSIIVHGTQIEIKTESGLPFPYLKFDKESVTGIDIGTYSYEEFKDGQNAPNCLVNLNQGFAASVWVLPKDTGTPLPIIALRALGQGREDYMLTDSDSVMVLSIEIMDSPRNEEERQPTSTASHTGHLVLRTVRPSSWNSGVPGSPQQMELIGTLPIPYDQWTLVTLAEPYSGGTRFFVNGKLDKQVQWNAWAAFSIFFTFGQLGNRSFVGNMAHISIWRTPLYEVPNILVQIPPVGLSLSEIAEREPLGLGGYWLLDEKDREIAYDLTSTRHNARLLHTLSINDFDWQAIGPGTTSIHSSNNSSIAFNYSLQGNIVYQLQTWRYFATASKTGIVKFNWKYSGFHGWYEVTATISAFSKGLSEQNQNLSFGVGGSMNGEGQVLIKINQGYEFGFVITGRNFDIDNRLLGSLTIAITDFFLDSLSPVENINWKPQNPVYANTVMTISWTSSEKATEYDVIILRDDNVQVLHQKVETTSLNYTLQKADIFHKLTATIYAYAEGYLPSPAVSQTYYCGNSRG